MSQHIQQDLTIQSEGEGGAKINCEGYLHRIEYDKNDRIKRAVIAWLVSWLLAILSLPIIFAHWVLVPGFIIAGPFIAYRYYHIMSVPKKITGSCPRCDEQMSVVMESSDKLPLWTYCSECKESVHVLEK